MPAARPKTQTLFHGQQDFADTKQTDHRDQKIEAVEQLGETECQAQLPGNGVEPDRGQREADHHRDNRLERRFLTHADETAKREEEHREFFCRTKLQREFRHQRRHQRDNDHGEQRTDKR
jgi:hypothetical protein